MPKEELTTILFFAYWINVHAFVVIGRLFSKHSFRNTIRVSNGWDPDQDQHSVGPDLGPNCLQRLSADD